MNILFLCVANSARSQIAEGLARHNFSHDAQIFSAGSQPSKINPYAVEVLSEKNIDATRQFSKSIEQVPVAFLNNLDFIITLCADEICPVLPSKHATKLHWAIPDPAGIDASEEELLRIFRSTRDEIEKRILKFGRANGLIKSESL